MPDASLPQRAAAQARRLLGWTEGTVLGDLLDEVRRTRLLDLAYTLSAQAFVALIPLLLVTTGAFSSGSDEAVAARSLIERFGLAGAAGQAVRVLFQTPGSGSGVYWLGLFVTLLAAFSLSRRVARAYATLWNVAPPGPGQQWRGLVWLVVQLVMIVFATSLRQLGRDHGVVVQVVAIVALLVAWTLTELLVEQLLTVGQVARNRLVVAAVVVSVGRLGVGAWSAVYLPASLSHQALQYGPIGVVFSFFTWILATVVALLAAIMVAAVFTARPAAEWFSRPEAAPGTPAAPET